MRLTEMELMVLQSYNKYRRNNTGYPTRDDIKKDLGKSQRVDDAVNTLKSIGELDEKEHKFGRKFLVRTHG